MVMIPFNGISIMVYFFKDNFGKDVSKQALLTKLPVSLPFFLFTVLHFCCFYMLYLFQFLPSCDV